MDKSSIDKFRNITALSVIILVGLMSLQTNALDGKIKKLAVIGVRNEINRPEWNNQLIGYGLSHLLLQGLYDTGNYVGLEDNPEIIGEIKRLIGTQWKGDAPLYTPEDADRIARNLGSEVVAYARAIKFSVKRRCSFMGPLSKAKTKVVVEVEVYLKEQGKTVKTSKGKGEASTNALGAFFEIRKDKVYFDKTTVGQAAQKAITNAIKGLRIK